MAPVALADRTAPVRRRNNVVVAVAVVIALGVDTTARDMRTEVRGRRGVVSGREVVRVGFLPPPDRAARQVATVVVEVPARVRLRMSLSLRFRDRRAEGKRDEGEEEDQMELHLCHFSKMDKFICQAA